MVYSVKSKIRIKGDLVVVRSLHVGGFGTSTNLDMPLAVNGQGQIYIPGTSLAGAFRGWMARVSDVAQVRSLWGYQPGSREPSDGGHASRVMIEDAVAYRSARHKKQGVAMTPRDIEIRSGVGIDRNTGTAAENFLYNRGVIPRGSVLSFELSVDILDDSRALDIKQAIDQLLLALTQEEIRLGAAKSRGLGRIRLENCQQPICDTPDSEGIAPLTLSNRQGMLAFLEHRSTPDYAPWSAPKSKQQSLPTLTVKLQWYPVEPLMVKSEMTGVVADILPLMESISDTQAAFLLPGASIKGALRTQGERIVRTLLPDLMEANQSFEEQIQLPLIESLFGVAAKPSATATASDVVTSGVAASETDSWETGLGALSIEDCFSDTQHPINTLQRLSQILKDDAAELEKVLNETGLSGKKFGSKVLGNAPRKIDTQLAYHVAIDRWTGGAADGFLYTNFEPFNIPWEPIELSLDFGRFRDKESKLAGVTLLLLLLRDMANKRIPLGYGTHRGLGTLTLTQADLAFSSHEAVPEKLRGVTATLNDLQRFEGIDDEILQVLNRAWGNWIVRVERAIATEQEKGGDRK